MGFRSGGISPSTSSGSRVVPCSGRPGRRWEITGKPSLNTVVGLVRILDSGTAVVRAQVDAAEAHGKGFGHTGCTLSDPPAPARLGAPRQAPEPRPALPTPREPSRWRVRPPHSRTAITSVRSRCPSDKSVRAGDHPGHRRSTSEMSGHPDCRWCGTRVHGDPRTPVRATQVGQSPLDHGNVASAKFITGSPARQALRLVRRNMSKSQPPSACKTCSA